MSSNLDMRNHSALMKRAEQLKRWEESDTNKESPHPKPEKLRKIRFPSGCVFLASCLSGDKDEVVKLLEDGADINTANVDGLTALHQACIDDNLDMVEFLVKQGADINRQDNEGWTPLHATASCGFVSIARFLVENGADLQAVNSDGELAVDISHCNDMADYLQSLVQELGIDCEAARRAEEELMYADAKKWLRSDASELDTAHPKTGATALHVAAAKGYSRVLKLIFAGRANVDKQDNDGWTPLHAAAHWCQKEACELLVNQMADMDVRNYAGQTCIDVADRSLRAFLEDLRANNKRNKKRPAADLSRIPDSTFPEKKIENHSPKLIRYDGKDEKEKEDKTKSHLQPPSPSVPAPSSNSSSTESLKVQSDSINDDDTPWRRNPSRIKVEDTTPKIQVPEKDNKLTSDDVILRRTQSFENDEKKPAVPPQSPNTPLSTPNAGQVRWSFVPPVRDEESETQRKAHARSVRQTRRSTQGVTLEEIKSAEELIKKKNANINNNNNDFKLEDASSGNTYPPPNNTIISSAPAVIAAANLSSSSAAQRRNISNNTPPITSNQRPVSVPTNTNNSNASTQETSSNDINRIRDSTKSDLALSKRNTSREDKENEQENDSRAAQATQSIIQRRRKPKRRSTGVVHVDMDDIDPDKQDSGDNDEKESGTERTSRSRLGSTNSVADGDNKQSNENGEIDYKALWEAAMLENDKLKQMLKKKDEEIVTAKAAVERFAHTQLDAFKTENKRLKEENGALIRVISKLSK